MAARLHRLPRPPSPAAGSEHPRCLLQVGQVTCPVALVSARTTSTVRARRPQELPGGCRRSPGPLRLRGEVEDHQPSRARGVQRGGELETSRDAAACRRTTSPARHHPVGVQAMAGPASGTAGGSAAAAVIHRTWPGVVAHSTCPRTMVTSAGLGRGPPPPPRPRYPAGPPPRDPACRAQPGYPVKAGHGVAEQVPQRDDGQVSDGVTGELAVAAEPVLHHLAPGISPSSSSRHSAASAIRRSPGGRTPKSRRSLPLDLLSSATVTIAVSSWVTRRRAPSDAASPWPPPSATVRTPVTRLLDFGPDPGARPGRPFRPGAPPARRRWRRERRTPPVQPTAKVHNRFPRADSRAARHPAARCGAGGTPRLRLGQHVVPHLRVLPGHGGQLGDPVRVGQEAAVRHDVGDHRQAVLVAERDQGQGRGPAAVPPPKKSLIRARSWWIEPRGVEHEVGVLADPAQRLPLGGDAVGHLVRALQRVRPPLAVERRTSVSSDASRNTMRAAAPRAASSLIADFRSC